MDNTPTTQSTDSAGTNRAGRDWVVTMGIPGLILGTGWAMMGFVNFWVGFLLLILADVVLVADWVRIVSRSYRRLTRILGAIVLILPAVLVCWMAFRPAPLEINVQVGPPFKGRELAGIEWSPEFMPMIVNIRNPTSRDYGDLDLVIGAGGHIFWQVKQTSESVPCQLFSGDQMTTPLGQVELGDGSRVPMRTGWFSKLYRVRCDKLPRHSSLEFISALVTKNTATEGANISAFGPATRPPGVRLDGEYTDANRPLTFSRTFSGAQLAGPP